MLSPYAKAIDSNTYEHLFKSLELKKFEFMATNSSTPSFSRNRLAKAAIFEASVVKKRFSSGSGIAYLKFIVATCFNNCQESSSISVQRNSPFRSKNCSG